MAPDGLTAYLLSTGGFITYYDVLSGTADLSVSTYRPGASGGYPGIGTQVFIHTDGTRLFWNEGVLLDVFDLNAHTVIHQFTSSLPSTSGVSMQLSQDGAQAFISNGAGAVVILDTRNGNVVGNYQSTGASQVFGGLPPLHSFGMGTCYPVPWRFKGQPYCAITVQPYAVTKCLGLKRR